MSMNSGLFVLWTSACWISVSQSAVVASGKASFNLENAMRLSTRLSSARLYLAMTDRTGETHTLICNVIALKETAHLYDTTS